MYRHGICIAFIMDYKYPDNFGSEPQTLQLSNRISSKELTRFKMKFAIVLATFLAVMVSLCQAEVDPRTDTVSLES